MLEENKTYKIKKGKGLEIVQSDIEKETLDYKGKCNGEFELLYNFVKLPDYLKIDRTERLSKSKREFDIKSGKNGEKIYKFKLSKVNKRRIKLKYLGLEEKVE